MKPWSTSAKAIFSVLLLFNLGLTSDPDVIVTDETSAKCSLGASKLCYHNFDSSTTTTTADSGMFQVSGCDKVSVHLSPSSLVQIQVYQCPTGTKDSTCSVFSHDKNGDGRVDSYDMSQVIDGSAGAAGIPATEPDEPNMYIDALSVPGSGTARVAVMCTPR